MDHCHRIALAATRFLTVVDRTELDAPVALTWTKLATAQGISALEGATPDPEDYDVLLDKSGEGFGAIDDGVHGTFVVVAIEGPRSIELRWEPDDQPSIRHLDVVLSVYRDGTAVDATVSYPADADKGRKEVAAELTLGLEAFRASVDGEED